jgi:hypothetical protein
VQSTALLILAARGRLDRLDGAIFANTGWEPRAIYDHLDRLEREVAEPAGIPIYRVSAGHIRDDALDPKHRFASMPLYVRNPDGSGGMGRRQCTSEYKLKPIKRKVRELLGAPPRKDGVPGRVKRGRVAETWVGISTDEAHRALDTKTNAQYELARWPLLELGLSRTDCQAINAAAGFPGTPKSACIGCPFHGNAQWRMMRDSDPESWEEAVQFDMDIRHGSARANAQGQLLRGENFLHRSRVPLGLAPIDHVTRHEWSSAQGDLVADLSGADAARMVDDDSWGCSPHSCRMHGDES